MLITNLTADDYWFGPMHLPAGSGQTLTIDDTTDTSLYLLNDEVADAVNTLYLASPPLISVTPGSLPFPRATGTPALLHGDGSPEGMVYGPQGSLYLRRDTVQASTSLYSKQTGVTQNTGWVSVIAAAGDLVPSAALTRDGCLLCDGTSYLRASYPVLFAAIGTSYGSVDGSHFNVPDLRGRFPLGAGTGTGSGATAWSVGQQPTSGAGGEQSHMQSTNELAQHNHEPQTDTSGGFQATDNPSSVIWNGTNGLNQSGTFSDRNNGTYASNQFISQTGSSSPMNILPPVSVVNWFIVHG
jgi:microcystin-dependent protein